MKALPVIALLGVANIANAIVVPNANEFVDADGTFSLTTTIAAGRTYQMTIAASELTGLNNMFITGMSFRLNAAAAAAWPTANASYTDWDIYVGPGVAPGSMSNTFADNFTATPIKVRDGGHVINAGSFTSGGNPNAFGPEIDFVFGYFYTGGDLAIEMRFSQQMGATTQLPADAVLASGGPGNGWGVNYAARWTGNFAGTSGVNGNFIVTQFQSSPVPEPGTMTALGFGAAFLLMRLRRKS